MRDAGAAAPPTLECIRTVTRIVGGAEFHFAVGARYQERVQRQRVACEAGRHEHNPVEDECCPCFGCCVPGLADRSDLEAAPDRPASSGVVFVHPPDPRAHERDCPDTAEEKP